MAPAGAFTVQLEGVAAIHLRRMVSGPMVRLAPLH